MSFDELKLPRLADPAELRRLKSATEQAVKLSGGSAFEAKTRVRKGALSKYGSPDREGETPHYIPLDVAVELDRHNGAPIVMSAAVGMLGYRLVPAGEIEAAELCYSDAQSIAKETSDVVNILLEVLASGNRLDAASRSTILREITEAKTALYKLSSKIHGGGHIGLARGGNGDG